MIEQLRSLGLPMRSWSYPHEIDVRDEDGLPTGETQTVRSFYGWTTDQAKADAARDLGATVRGYQSRDVRFNGWEVSCRVVEP